MLLAGSRGDKAVPRTPGPQVSEEEQLREIESLRGTVQLGLQRPSEIEI